MAENLEIQDDEKLLVISSSSIKSSVKSFFEQFQEWRSFSESIFGTLNCLGAIYYSDLSLDPDSPPPEILVRDHVAIPNKAQFREESNAFTTKVIMNPVFHGKVEIINGGIYPAVFTSQIINSK